MLDARRIWFVAATPHIKFLQILIVPLKRSGLFEMYFVLWEKMFWYCLWQKIRGMFVETNKLGSIQKKANLQGTWNVWRNLKTIQNNYWHKQTFNTQWRKIWQRRKHFREREQLLFSIFTENRKIKWMWWWDKTFCFTSKLGPQYTR